MSAQIVEILFFAGIAFLIISKLISILGTTDEDDPACRSNRSFFGEPKGMKDVTGKTENVNKSPLHLIKALKSKIDSTEESKLSVIFEKFPDFNEEKFVSGAKAAFKMIISALDNKDSETLDQLVDKRFISALENKSEFYGKIKSDKITASCIDSYSFGNSVYIKVLFEGKNITTNLGSLKESWVFTKNISQTGPDWYLSNIENLS